MATFTGSAEGMKIYKVKVFLETVVLAADKEQAKLHALDVMKFEDDPGEAEEPVEITRLQELPKGWNGGCRPWGERDEYERDLRQLLTEGPKEP